ncbi:MAG: hypothetical protein JWR26_1157 [Pedosphaera sp.]|nr:hypothetical protein [Pedosphaera sp.]
MLTITGKIEDASGAALHATIDFVSRSTPLVGAGIVTTNTDKTIRSNPSTGQFSVQLAAGNYAVTIAANGQTTAFNIAVPDGSGTVSIETVVSSPLVYANVAPMTVWNGVRQGHITFNPIANPAAPGLTPVHYSGGHQGALDAFAYQIAWLDANGDGTAASADAANTPPVAPANATRVLLPSPPSGVSSVLIYRSTNDGTTNRYLLASVAQNVAFYDDWESTADFNARLNATLTSPVYNTTAGQFFGSTGGNAVFWITDQGIRIFLGAQFDSDIHLGGADNIAPNQTVTGTHSILTKGLADGLYAAAAGANYRFKNGQLQVWDATAAAADPTKPWRALSVDNGNTVWSNPVAI